MLLILFYNVLKNLDRKIHLYVLQGLYQTTQQTDSMILTKAKNQLTDNIRVQPK